MSELTLIVNRWTIITRKVAVALELLRGGEAVAVVRRHGLSQAQLFAWWDWALEGGRWRSGLAAEAAQLFLGTTFVKHLAPLFGNAMQL
jgi:transposase-like protein